MKLYKISQSANDNYDTYDSAIVLANSEFEAQRIHPEYDWKREHCWCNTPALVTVKYLGEADPSLGTEPTVILASFNAG